jgi:curved DNA-binding protein CbpA
MEQRKNYYDVLEVKINASQEDIQKSYTRSKNAYSEDSVAMYSLLSTQECERILDEIEEAYSILSVPEKRREYDRIRGLGVSVTPTPQPESIFELTQKYQEKPIVQRTTVDESISHLSVDDMFNYAGPKSSEDFQFSDSRVEENKYEEARSHQDVLKFDNESTKSNVKVARFSAMAIYQLDYEVNHDMEAKIENCEVFTGSFLKEIREYKNVSVERLSEMTKISKTHIRNIENEYFEKLPAVVYTRGFIFQIAKSLKLNADLICTSFMHHRKKVLETPKNESE